MTIMIPLDTSDLAASAVPVGTRLAKALGDDLLLVTVLDPMIQSGGVRQFAEVEGEDVADVVLAGLRAVARSITDVPVTVDLLPGADAPSAIIERAKHGGIDMIVLASHGRSGVERWMMGSVAERVVRQAGVPVLVVPAPWRATKSADATTKAADEAR
jgi:nucleotide-binding universal stress UspA family protein